jgi:hypothetical protein
MNKITLLLGFLLFSITSFSQSLKIDSANKHKLSFIDFSTGFSNNQALISTSYSFNWGIGKKQRLLLGVGARLTNTFGTDQYFTTANAKLTSGKTGPGVLFADDIPANIDSFFVGKPQINALNISFNSEYQLSKKLSVGFNIDLLGFSFGASKTGTYINNGRTSLVGAKPTSLNILLISDNDIGSLNSEIFARYKLNSKWSLRGGAAFLFNEYTTNTAVQQLNGISNDRFRTKTLNAMIGISYQF